MKVGKPFNPYGLFIGSFIPNCVMQYPNLKGNAKLLWARLAQYAGQNGKCYPSMDTLAKDLGVARSTVQELIDDLIGEGFIVKIQPSGASKLMHRNCSYEFLWHDCMNTSSKDDDDTENRYSEVPPKRYPEVPDGGYSELPDGGYSNIRHNNNREYTRDNPSSDEEVLESILHKHKSVIHKKINKGKNSISDTHKYFCMIAKDYGYEIAFNITGVDNGYWKSVIKSTGVGLVPFLEYVVKHWKALAKRERNVPPVPNIKSIYYNFAMLYDAYKKGEEGTGVNTVKAKGENRFAK